MTELSKHLLRNWGLMSIGMGIALVATFYDFYCTGLRGMLFVAGIVFGVWLTISMYCLVVGSTVKS
jgi:hypothetical protein